MTQLYNLGDYFYEDDILPFLLITPNLQWTDLSNGSLAWQTDARLPAVHGDTAVKLVDKNHQLDSWELLEAAAVWNAAAVLAPYSCSTKCKEVARLVQIPVTTTHSCRNSLQPQQKLTDAITNNSAAFISDNCNNNSQQK